MLDAAREAITFVDGSEREVLGHQRVLVLAPIQSIQIVGEAASKISPDARQSMPRIPWPQIVAMRNRLIHGYFDVDLDRVWDTVTADLPPLVAELEKALAADRYAE